MVIKVTLRNSRWLSYNSRLVIMSLVSGFDVIIDCKGKCLWVILSDCQGIFDHLTVTDDALLRCIVTHDTLAAHSLVTDFYKIFHPYAKQ